MGLKNSFHIAIDGPVAAGKGTISKLSAEELGFVYVDTGAMYRVVALAALREGVSLSDESALVSLIESSQIDLRNPEGEEKDTRSVTVMLNGEDVSWKIRTEEVGTGASTVAQLKDVRRALVILQQQIAKGKNVVMEGRDITYRVLPDAQLKIYLTASDVVRAKRRHLQLQTRGEMVEFEKVFQELIERDYNDTHRSVDPLKIVEGAWVLDTSDLDVEKVVAMIVAKVQVLQQHTGE